MTSPEDFEILNMIRVMRQLKKKLKNENDPDKKQKLKKRIELLEQQIEEYTLNND